MVTLDLYLEILSNDKFRDGGIMDVLKTGT
jgi:hypothetical protein